MRFRIFHANQENLRMTEVFRGALVREWESIPNEIVDYSQCNKVLIAKGVSLHAEYWNQCFLYCITQK